MAPNPVKIMAIVSSNLPFNVTVYNGESTKVEEGKRCNTYSRIVTGDAAKKITKLVRSLFPGKEYSHRSQAWVSFAKVFLRLEKAEKRRRGGPTTTTLAA
jgi:hypothetical protein